ncbi:MAG: hypothetical protein H7Y04_03330 [Verrucomicrobia bacterium]|nr:hypothetical protein [Cytophagales bacterium]
MATITGGVWGVFVSIAKALSPINKQTGSIQNFVWGFFLHHQKTRCWWNQVILAGSGQPQPAVQIFN